MIVQDLLLILRYGILTSPSRRPLELVKMLVLVKTWCESIHTNVTRRQLNRACLDYTVDCLFLQRLVRVISYISYLMRVLASLTIRYVGISSEVRKRMKTL